MAQNLNQLKAAVLQPLTMGIKGAYSRQAKAKQEQKQRAILDQLDEQKRKERAVQRARKQENE